MSPVSWGPTLRSIVTTLEGSDVRELEVRAGGLRVRVRRDFTPRIPTSAPVAEQPDTSGLHTLRCPLTGIWYDSPAPGSPPFVSVGDALDIGTVVGLVETMKVFNEVASDAAGIVRHIFVRRGELVSEQAPIIAIEPTENDITLTAEQLV